MWIWTESIGSQDLRSWHYKIRFLLHLFFKLETDCKVSLGIVYGHTRTHHDPSGPIIHINTYQDPSGPIRANLTIYDNIENYWWVFNITLMGPDWGFDVYYGFWWVLWVQMGPDGSRWVLMGPVGSCWVLMGPDWCWWVLMGNYGSLWALMGPDVSWWVLMCPDGSW